MFSNGPCYGFILSAAIGQNPRMASVVWLARFIFAPSSLPVCRKARVFSYFNFTKLTL